MSWITVVWSMIASAILTLALLHLVIWFNQRRQWAHLCLSIAAVAVAVITGMELMGLRATSIDQMASLQRWVHRKRTTPPSKNFSGAQVSLNFF
jgi:hypothetical protein